MIRGSGTSASPVYKLAVNAIAVAAPPIAASRTLRAAFDPAAIVIVVDVDWRRQMPVANKRRWRERRTSVDRGRRKRPAVDRGRRKRPAVGRRRRRIAGRWWRQMAITWRRRGIVIGSGSDLSGRSGHSGRSQSHAHKPGRFSHLDLSYFAGLFTPWRAFETKNTNQLCNGHGRALNIH